MSFLERAVHATSHKDDSKKKDRPGDVGFTLVELMVVIITVGVLASIAVPVYLNITRRADEQVAAYNVKVAEEVHNHIWFDIMTRNYFIPGSECYRDASPPDGITSLPSGYALVDAEYFSALETRISWVDMEATGPFAEADSRLWASLDGGGEVTGGTATLTYEIDGIYREGTLVESGYQIQNSLDALHGKIAVITEYFYLDGAFHDNTDNKYLTMIIMEKSGDVHVLTFYQGIPVLAEEVSWPDESTPIPAPMGPEVIDSLTAPGTINLDSEGTFNTSFEVELEIYPGFNIDCIEMDTVKCGDASAVDIKVNDAGKVIIKFDRQDLTGLSVGEDQILTVTGQYTDGNTFSGSTMVKVIDN